MGRKPRTELKIDAKFQHIMPAELAHWLEIEAIRMGTSRRGLMNILLTQYKDKKEMTG